VKGSVDRKQDISTTAPPAERRCLKEERETTYIGVQLLQRYEVALGYQLASISIKSNPPVGTVPDSVIRSCCRRIDGELRSYHRQCHEATKNNQ
jgi:hypothetical protein